MKRILTVTAIILSLAVSAPAIAQPALSINPSGTVNMTGDVAIAGTLKAAAVQADNLDAALAEIKAQNDLILQGLQWVLYADTVNAAFEKVSPEDLLNHEFGIQQDGGFREALFSTHNDGLALITSPYMVANPKDGNNVSTDRLGGTAWYLGQITLVDVSTGSPVNITIGCTNGNAAHLPYKFSGGEVKPIFQPGETQPCTDTGQVYARKRLFR